MQLLGRNKMFRLFALVVATVLLVPSGVKFSHAFTHHHHEVCKGEPETHLHKTDVDCSLYKFNIHSPFTLTFFDIELPLEETFSFEIIGLYTFTYNHQHLSFSLRGPPSVIV